MSTQAGSNTRGIHRLVSGLDYFGGRFDEERILGWETLEQNFLYRSLPASAQELSDGDEPSRTWCLTSVSP